MNTDDVTDTFYAPCLTCGGTMHIINGVNRHTHLPPTQYNPGELIARAWWAGHDAALANGRQK